MGDGGWVDGRTDERGDTANGENLRRPKVRSVPDLRLAIPATRMFDSPSDHLLLTS